MLKFHKVIKMSINEIFNMYFRTRENQSNVKPHLEPGSMVSNFIMNCKNLLIEEQKSNTKF